MLNSKKRYQFTTLQALDIYASGMCMHHLAIYEEEVGSAHVNSGVKL